MKAATGELNLTVITVIAIAAVIGFFWLLWSSTQLIHNGQIFHQVEQHHHQPV